MTAADGAVRWSRGLIGLSVAMLALVVRARSVGGFVVAVFASLACGLAVASERRVETELHRARVVLAPLLFTAESTSTGR